MKHVRILSLLSGSVALVALASCGDDQGAAKSEPASTHADHTGHDHAPAAHSDSHTGSVIDLGTATIGQFSVKATRDQQPFVAGKDAPVDMSITPSAGGTARVVSVRFWVGTQDGKGSVKAKADIEDPKDPARWHTHVEIPNPLPSGSQIWVEIESDVGEPVRGSFGPKS